MNTSILQCDNVYKKIGKKNILNGINLEINEGEILAFIGPNGAGKTTTIKVILGLQKITDGKIKINGFDIKKDFINAIKKVGAIVENPDLYMYMSGYDNLKIVKDYYNNISEERINEVVHIVGLENRIKDKVCKYSLGMRQRLGIAQAILHKPNLLILDEPTNGLDPEGIIEIRELLKRLSHNENMSILISSHNLSELENICSKVCIIKNGTIIEETTINKLKNEGQEECYILETSNTSMAINYIREKFEMIDQNNIKIYTSKSNLPNIRKTLEQNDIAVYTITKINSSLEEAFLKRIGGNKID